MLSPKKSDAVQHGGYTLLNEFSPNGKYNNGYSNSCAIEDKDAEDSFSKMLTGSSKKKKKKPKGQRLQSTMSTSLMISESEDLTSEEKEEDEEEETAFDRSTLAEVELGYSNGGGLVQRGGGGSKGDRFSNA